jgi:phage FluMu protein Com
MAKIRCTVCNLILDTDAAPDKCPRCGAPKEKFETLAEDKANLIERSRLTNDLHMKLEALLGKVLEIAEAGIKDNLDPACVVVFNKAKQDAAMIRQYVKAEIQAHIGKGNWG